ncbi:hypothetical protein HMPREF1275_01386 [Propionibacterium sp. KPL1844]|nr:hypothetical protein HMPREF1275_01386 [Propionibacterium sp. KPL1844]
MMRSSHGVASCREKTKIIRYNSTEGMTGFDLERWFQEKRAEKPGSTR